VQLATKSPRSHIFGDDRAAHALGHNRRSVTNGLRREKFLWMVTTAKTTVAAVPF
jgi:hypothetical protein